MPLILSEEQTMLRDSARDFLAEQAPVSQLRALRDSRDAERATAERERAVAMTNGRIKQALDNVSAPALLADRAQEGDALALRPGLRAAVPEDEGAEEPQ